MLNIDKLPLNQFLLFKTYIDYICFCRLAGFFCSTLAGALLHFFSPFIIFCCIFCSYLMPQPLSYPIGNISLNSFVLSYYCCFCFKASYSLYHSL